MAPRGPILQLRSASWAPSTRLSGVGCWCREHESGPLHDVTQAAAGWEDHHLHAFTANDVDYGPLDPHAFDADEVNAILRGRVGVA